MNAGRKTPLEIARRLSRRPKRELPGAWRRQTYTLPRGEARAKAHEWFDAFPKAAYMTEIQSLARTRGRADRIHHPSPAERGLTFKPLEYPASARRDAGRHHGDLWRVTLFASTR